MTLERLAQAYKEGAVTEPLYLDNDSTTVYQGDEKVFDMDPADLLVAALDLLGIPHENV